MFGLWSPLAKRQHSRADVLRGHLDPGNCKDAQACGCAGFQTCSWKARATLHGWDPGRVLIALGEIGEVRGRAACAARTWARRRAAYARGPRRGVLPCLARPPPCR